MTRDERYYAAVPVFIPHTKRVEPRYIFANGQRVSNPRMGLCGVCGLPAIDCRAPETSPQSPARLGMVPCVQTWSHSATPTEPALRHECEKCGVAGDCECWIP